MKAKEVSIGSICTVKFNSGVTIPPYICAIRVKQSILLINKDYSITKHGVTYTPDYFTFEPIEDLGTIVEILKKIKDNDI